MKKNLCFEQFYGKTLTDIKAFGTDSFDFTRNILGLDFSVGEFGYAVLIVGGCNIYISAEGLSADVPARKNISELPVDEEIRSHFIGSVLESVEYEDGYRIRFCGLDTLYGSFSPNGGYTDRSYFELEFPWK